VTVHNENTAYWVRTREEYKIKRLLANKHSGIRDDKERPTTYKVDKHRRANCHGKIEDLQARYVNMPKQLSADLPVSSR
jgi:hypothetical protein